MNALRPASRLRAQASGISAEGCGIFRAGGMDVEVPGTVPGDFAEIEALPSRGRGRRRRGRLLSLITSSPCRVPQEEACPFQLRCGGCPLGLMTEGSQLEHKRKMLVASLRKGGARGIEVPPVSPSDPGVTRFKGIRFFAQDGGRVVQGFYRRGSHEIVEVPRCPRECGWFGDLASATAELASSMGVPAYVESSRRGSLRALMMRDCGEGGTMAVLSHAGVLDANFARALAELMLEHGVSSSWTLRNDSEGNAVMGGALSHLAGARAVTAKLNGFSYSAGPMTFLQVNYPVAQRLYAAALDWCGSDPQGTALDLCCGAGAMTLPLARSFKKAVGVEIVDEAVEAARANAAANHVDNAKFVAGDLAEVLPGLMDGSVSAVIADPSRRGLGAKACRALGGLRSGARLAFVFCGLGALERDLPVVIDGGFTVRSARGFDMFPGSSALEALVLLEKN
jgi:23S rRNA (uracil1939-C5)-methyltransferase